MIDSNKYNREFRLKALSDSKKVANKTYLLWLSLPLAARSPTSSCDYAVSWSEERPCSWFCRPSCYLQSNSGPPSRLTVHACFALLSEGYCYSDYQRPCLPYFAQRHLHTIRSQQRPSQPQSILFISLSGALCPNRGSSFGSA